VHPLFGRKFLEIVENFRWENPTVASANKIWLDVFKKLRDVLGDEALAKVCVRVFVKREEGEWFAPFGRSFASEEGMKKLDVILQDHCVMQEGFKFVVHSRVLRSAGWKMRKTNRARALELVTQSIRVGSKAIEKLPESHEVIGLHNKAMCCAQSCEYRIR
jgi:hypothetical protein